MADVPPPEAPKPILSEALAFGGEAKPGFSSGIKAAQDFAKELRKFQQEHKPDAKTTLEEIKERYKEKNQFGKDRAEGMKARFGAGAAKLNDEKKAELDPSASAEATANFDQASKVIDGVTDLIEYSQIVQQAQATGKDINLLLQEKHITQAEFQNTKVAALDTILNHSVTQDLFPELRELGAPNAQRAYIEATLASDPQLANSLIAEMRDLQARAEGFQEFKEDPELREARGNREESEKASANLLEQIKSQAGDFGVDLDDAFITRVNKMIESGTSEVTVNGYIHETLLGKLVDKSDLSEFGNIQKHFETKAIYKQLEQKIDAASKKETPDANIKKWQEQMEQVKGEIDAFESRIANEPDMQNQLRVLNNLNSQFAQERDPEGKVVPVGETAQYISSWIEAQRKFKQADEIVKRKEKELGDKPEKDRKERLIKESELIEDLEKVLGNSILKTIDERYDAVTELTKERHKKQVSEAKTEADKVVIKAIENNWVSYNRLSRSKDVHRDRIGRDMRVAAYMGDDGIKRMILRDLRAGGIELKDKDGNVIDAASYLDEGVLDKLSDSHREVVDKMYTEKGEEYRTKLFTDFFAARNLKDRLGYGIGLKDHEWELMEKHFGEKIDAGLQNSKEAQTVMTNLAERGVAKPNFKFKWLLYVLIGLGLLAKGAASSI